MNANKERRFLVRAGLRRNYGKHEVYYELSEEILATSTGQVRDAFINLQTLLENQIAVYEQVSLPHVKLPDVQSGDSETTPAPDDFNLECIKVEFTNGKRIVKATGGQWTKHGVPVYEECSTDLPIETLDYGVHDYRHLNLRVKADIVGGKPKRAVSIK